MLGVEPPSARRQPIGQRPIGEDPRRGPGERRTIQVVGEQNVVAVGEQAVRLGAARRDDRNARRPARPGNVPLRVFAPVFIGNR